MYNPRTRPHRALCQQLNDLQQEQAQLLVIQDAVCLRATLLACRYASADALEKLGVVYKAATDLLQEYYDCFVDETRLAGKGPAMIKVETGVAALEKDMLQKKIARPLSECCPLRLKRHISAHPPFVASSLMSDLPCMHHVASCERGSGLQMYRLNGQQALCMVSGCSLLLQVSCRHHCRERQCYGRAASL